MAWCSSREGPRGACGPRGRGRSSHGLGTTLDAALVCQLSSRGSQRPDSSESEAYATPPSSSAELFCSSAKTFRS